MSGMGNDEREQTLNQLLTELDGFEMGPPGKPVICLAAGAYTPSTFQLNLSRF
jgi:cell division protease FtsH